jgi:hypothetical protein
VLKGLPLLLAVALMIGVQSRAYAIPVFAHRYGLSCQVCHTIVPHLTPFGQAFMRDGFRIPPGFPSHAVVPVTVKVNVQYSNQPQPATLPKVIVDELEFVSAASISSHFSYRFEQYAVDGGFPGLTRDAWVTYDSRPQFAGNVASLRATTGQFTLPLPVDPETERPTQNHYLIFDQTVGANPFNLFDDRIGLDTAYGRQVRGFDIQGLVMKGHDPQSGLPTLGLDTMIAAQHASAPARFSAYWYRGERPLGPINDAFSREGLGANFYWDRAELDLLAQAGHDSSANGFGLGAPSSGGCSQLWWWFSPSLLGVARFDTAYDALTGTDRSMTTSLVFRPYRNASLTLEKVFGWGHNTTNAAWLFAY